MNFMEIFFLKSHGLNPVSPWDILSGKFDQLIHIDTTVRILKQLVHIIYNDTITTKISSYSIAGSVEHSFMFFNLFSIKDGIIITPQLSLISGINTYDVSHTSSLANFNTIHETTFKKNTTFSIPVE